jgi:hypothetical protein
VQPRANPPRYGALRVQKNKVGGWVARRDRRILGDDNGPVTFPTVRHAQRAADLHLHDGYPNSRCPGDNLSWSRLANGAARDLFWIERAFGDKVANAAETRSRVQMQFGNGGMQTATQQEIAWQTVHLHEIWEASSFGSFDSKRRVKDPYFVVKRGKKQQAIARMSFDDAAQHMEKSHCDVFTRTRATWCSTR